MIKKILLALGIIFVSCSLAASCQFSWVKPTTHTDGSPIVGLTDVIIYFQESYEVPWVQEWMTSAMVATIIIPGPCKVGIYTMTVMNRFGVESGMSNNLVIKKPNPPTDFTGNR